MAYKNRFDPECITYTDENIIQNKAVLVTNGLLDESLFNSVFAGIGSERKFLPDYMRLD